MTARVAALPEFADGALTLGAATNSTIRARPIARPKRNAPSRSFRSPSAGR